MQVPSSVGQSLPKIGNRFLFPFIVLKIAGKRLADLPLESSGNKPNLWEPIGLKYLKLAILQLLSLKYRLKYNYT